MADFNSLVADVYTLTNRPDLVAETELAVKAATLKLHKRDNFPKDLFETGLIFDTLDYIQQIQYRDIIPKYRSLKYIRKFDATSNTPGIKFTLITPDEIFDQYNCQRKDVMYLAGDQIQILSSTQIDHALFGCYLFPTVDSAASYSSWIALEQPYAIVFEAAAQVYSILENDKASVKYRALANEEMIEVINNNILAEGS